MSSQRTGDAFNRLCAIMATLRSPEGCPWDAAQTPESLAAYIIEEAYEVVEAIHLKNHHKICEELGDLLLQVIFQAQIHDEIGLFNAADIATGISNKLVRRHPHVFADQNFTSEQDLHDQWERIKQDENSANGEPPGVLKGIPKTLPALQRAQKILARSQKTEVPLTQVIKTKPNRTTAEIDIAVDLLQIVARARQIGVDAETALRNLCSDYQEHFESREQNNPDLVPPDKVDVLFWDIFWSTHQG